MIPYKGIPASVEENANFNTQLARLRIVAEQVIGQVKMRFSCLQELRVQIETIEDVIRGGEWIIEAFLLHNLCIKERDYVAPRDTRAFRCSNATPDSTQTSSEENAAFLRREGLKQDVVRSMLAANRCVARKEIFRPRVPQAYF